jgi:macrolide transport system ATP-binding/permease protein
MNLWSHLKSWLRSILLRSRAEREMDAELRFHLEAYAEDLIRSGVPGDEALRRARIEFGGLEQAKEQCRDATGISIFESLLHDLRFALRQWTKTPGLASTAVLILALGMGISVAIFGFVDAALLEPLPYANPSRLMSVNEGNVESPRWPLSYLDYLDWQRLNRSFSSLDVYNETGYLLRTPTGVEPVQVERVSGGFFRTLGVHPLLGRDFYTGEDRPGGPNVAILSYGAWLNHFNARRDVVGQTMDLDNELYTVIGVLPREFSFAPGGNAEFWVPVNSFSPHEKMRTFYSFWGVGRLRDGVAIPAALAEMTGIAKQLQQQYATTGRNLSASIVPLSEIIVGDVRPILLTLLGGAGLLLLIACVNVASLVLVRSESRKREIALREALGASRARLVRQFATEGLLLAGFGSAVSVIVAAWLMKLLARIVPKEMEANMPFLGGVGLNAHTTEFAVAIALMAALLLAAVPMFRVSFEKVREGLADGGSGSGSQLWHRLGARMVMVELAVAVVLLAGAGLLGKSFYRLLHVTLGFDPSHLATVRVMAPETSYKDDEQVVRLHQEIVRRVSTLPGVSSVGLTSMLPVQCNCAIDDIQIEGRPFQGEHNDVDERHISSEYLPALKARLLGGRLFNDSDSGDASNPGVAVINETLARKFFPGENPVGHRIANDEGGRPSMWEIVGVVEDVREGPLDVDTWPTEYFPISQTRDHYFSLAVRTQQDAGALLPVLVSTLHGIDPNLGTSDEMTMNDQIGTTQTALLHQFSAWLVGGFAAMALILGVVGLYGVIAYSVSQRTREIGIRIALGAGRGSVYRLVLARAGWLTGAGLAIGLVCSAGASLLIRSLLFGVEAWDAATLVCVAILLGLASMVASFLPARRAARVDPVIALRYE